MLSRWQDSLPLHDQIIAHCIFTHTASSHPLICSGLIGSSISWLSWIMLQWILRFRILFFEFIFIFFKIILSSGTAESYVKFYFSFWETFITVFHTGWTNFSFPLIVRKGSLFSTSLPMLVILYLFDNSCYQVHYDIQCGFDTLFQDDQWCWNTFT